MGPHNVDIPLGGARPTRGALDGRKNRVDRAAPDPDTMFSDTPTRSSAGKRSDGVERLGPKPGSAGYKGKRVTRGR
jgi:hypothetical protein